MLFLLFSDKHSLIFKVFFLLLFQKKNHQMYFHVQEFYNTFHTNYFLNTVTQKYQKRHEIYVEFTVSLECRSEICPTITSFEQKNSEQICKSKIPY